MAALPEIPRDGLLEAIEAGFMATVDLAPRAHLGASVLGQPCERRGWYTFRWGLAEAFIAEDDADDDDTERDTSPQRNTANGRMLRLFDRGKREEDFFVHLLKLAGCAVETHDSAGRQFLFTEPELGGHLAGSIDAVLLAGLPEAPKAPHLCEFKTHCNKSFNAMCRNGVQKSKPEHYDQMQLYMRWTVLSRALYLAVNKNDDRLYAERVAADPEHAARLVAKAARIIEAASPDDVSRVAMDPAWYQCKLCPFHALCYSEALPSVTCRTCLHATPLTGTLHEGGRWHCAKWDAEIPLAESRKAQPCHRYIPALIPWAAVIDATDAGEVIYEMRDGSHRSFANGEAQPAYLSTELRAVNPAHIGAEAVEALKKPLTAGSFEPPLTTEAAVETADFWSDDIPF